MRTNPITNDSKRVHLLPKEKEVLLARLQSTMSVQSAHTLPTPSPYFSYTWLLRASGAFAVLLIVTGGSVSYAAQKSGPGDALYALELDVLEPIEESLQLGFEQKVSYHTDRLEERLSELKHARDTEEDPGHFASFSERASEHVSEAEAALKNETEPRAKIAALIELNALMRANEDILEEMHAESQAFDDSEQSIRRSLHDAAESYGDSEDAESVRTAISEDLTATGKNLDPEEDPDAITALTQKLNVVAEEVEEGDLSRAIELVTEVRVEMLKSQFLKEEN